MSDAIARALAVSATTVAKDVLTPRRMMPALFSPSSTLLILLAFTLGQGITFIKVAVALVVLGVLYQLVRHRRLFTQTRSGFVVWWGGMMLLGWAVLVYFAIQLRWLWHFFFG